MIILRISQPPKQLCTQIFPRKEDYVARLCCLEQLLMTDVAHFPEVQGCLSLLEFTHGFEFSRHHDGGITHVEIEHRYPVG
jgi:hypothetical protein